MHALRANDRLAVSKLVTQLTRGNVRSPMAQCLLVRYVAQVIAESQPGQGSEARPFYDFLESCLRHKSEVVIFEVRGGGGRMGGWGGRDGEVEQVAT